MVPFHLRDLHPKLVVGHGGQNSVHIGLIHLEPHGDGQVPAHLVADQVACPIKAVERRGVSRPRGRAATGTTARRHRCHAGWPVHPGRTAGRTGGAAPGQILTLFLRKRGSNLQVGGLEVTDVLSRHAQLDGRNLAQRAVGLLENLGRQKLLAEVQGAHIHGSELLEAAGLAVRQRVPVKAEGHARVRPLRQQELGFPAERLVVKGLRTTLAVDIPQGAFFGKLATGLGDERQFPGGVHQHHRAGILLGRRHAGHHGHFGQCLAECLNHLTAHRKVFLKDPEFLRIRRHGEGR